MAISYQDLGVDEDLGRRILVRARVIAPCLDSLTDEARSDAIAILKGVVAELPEPGSRRAKSLSRDGTAITFDVAAAFTADDETSLRSLCAAASSGQGAGHSVGSFPRPGVVDRIWVEGPYS